MKTAIELALEALELASQCGGELDLDFYTQAHTALKQAVEEVRSHDRMLNAKEAAPTGVDYEHIVSLLGLRECDNAGKPVRCTVGLTAGKYASPPHNNP